MLTCKQVSDALDRSDHHALPLASRLALRFHLGICFVCRGYNRQLMQFYDLARGFRRAEENEPAPAQRLPDDARARIRAAINGKSS